MIKDPKSDPFNPITTSTFVCRIAIVTVDASTPTAVLHRIIPPRLHKPQPQRMKLPHRAENRVQIGAHGEVGDGEVADDAEAQADARHRGRDRVPREIEQNIALRVLAEHQIAAHWGLEREKREKSTGYGEVDEENDGGSADGGQPHAARRAVLQLLRA